MLLIKNAHIKTMAGPELENGCILVDDNGKIAQVAENITAEGAQVIDAEGRLVTPGCVEAHCHIGLGCAGMRWEGSDFNEKSDPVTPQLRAIDAINREYRDKLVIALSQDTDTLMKVIVGEIRGSLTQG